MLFVRSFPGLLGGELKVFDYLGHVAAWARFEPLLHLRPGAADARPYLPANVRIVDRPIPADAYFVGGADWRHLDEAKIDMRGRPVINLIQGFRHLMPHDPHFAYLARPALRICVSEALASALRASGRVNGPIETIPNGLDLGYLSRVATARQNRVFIAGLKHIALAVQIAERLRAEGVDVDCSIEREPREEFLRRMASCAVTVALPFDFEGFYLPALEAMALGSAVVIPHAIGPATYCIDGESALVSDVRFASTRGECAAAVARSRAPVRVARRRCADGERAFTRARAGGVSRASRPASSGGRRMNASPPLFVIVAHQDDWQIFMGKEVYARLREGRRVVVIVTTAGDAGEDAWHWKSRLSGLVVSTLRALPGWSPYEGDTPSGYRVAYDVPTFASKRVLRVTIDDARANAAALSVFAASPRWRGPRRRLCAAIAIAQTPLRGLRASITLAR